MWSRVKWREVGSEAGNQEQGLSVCRLLSAICHSSTPDRGMLLFAVPVDVSLHLRTHLSLWGRDLGQYAHERAHQVKDCVEVIQLSAGDVLLRLEWRFLPLLERALTSDCIWRRWQASRSAVGSMCIQNATHSSSWRTGLLRLESGQVQSNCLAFLPACWRLSSVQAAVEICGRRTWSCPSWRFTINRSNSLNTRNKLNTLITTWILVTQLNF